MGQELPVKTRDAAAWQLSLERTLALFKQHLT